MRHVYLDSKKSIKVLLPSIEFFRRQIANKNQFVSVKVNHGWWDAVSDIKEEIDHKGYVDLVSKRRIERTKQQISPGGLSENWYGGIDNQILRVQNLKWIDIITKYDEQPKNLYIGISPTNGVSPTNAKLISNLSCIKKWSKNNSRMFYHGGLFRHYAIMNELQSLIKIINDHKIKVHFIGPDFCKQYGSLFSSFNFIEIPYTGGANQINDVYDQLLENSKRGDIVFASFGDSESLLIDFCFNNGLTLIGIGRAFDYLFKGKIPKQPWFRHPHEKLKKQVLQWRKNS